MLLLLSQTLVKGIVHPQNDFFSIDYSCHGDLSSIIFFCICCILKTKNDNSKFTAIHSGWGPKCIGSFVVLGWFGNIGGSDCLLWLTVGFAVYLVFVFALHFSLLSQRGWKNGSPMCLHFGWGVRPVCSSFPRNCLFVWSPWYLAVFSILVLIQCFPIVLETCSGCLVSLVFFLRFLQSLSYHLSFSLFFLVLFNTFRLASEAVRSNILLRPSYYPIYILVVFLEGFF